MSDVQDSDETINNMSVKLASATFNPQEQSKLSTKTLLELNIPEKILFVIDTVKEENYTPFKLGTGEVYSPLYMIKRVVETFVNAKSTINKKHEYGLLVFNTMDINLICDFTNNIKTVLNHLDSIEESTEENKICDLEQIFEKIKSHLSWDHFTHFPNFISRVILIYARSNCIPQFYNGTKCLETLPETFFLDVLYVHEPLISYNQCEKVYAQLTALDTRKASYILEVGRNAATLHHNMAKLLAHPLQRPPQKDSSYTVCASILSQEESSTIHEF